MKTKFGSSTIGSQIKTTNTESTFQSVYFNLQVLFLFCCLGIAIYSNTFQSSFHLDDTPSIVDNFSIRNIFNLNAVWSFWPTRFITYLSVAINYHFHRLNVFGYHLFNLIVHIGTALLAWRFTLLTLYTPVIKENKIAIHARSIAFFVGLVFLTHPLQTQGVTYIIQRASSMAALFYLASLSFYAKSRLLQFEERHPGGRILCYIVSLITAVMAMFTKEMTITLPLLILLYEFYFFKVGKRSIPWKRIVPFLILLAVIPFTMWVTKSVNFKEMHRAVEAVPGISPVKYLLTQFRVLITYLRLILIPLNQNLDYDYPLAKSILEIPVLVSIAFLVTVIVGAIRLFSRYRLLSFCIFWFFLTLLPESSFVPIKDVIFEHRLYLPVFGYSLFLVVVFFYLFGHKNIKLVLILLLVITTSYSILTYRRNSFWKDEFAIWNDAAKKSPRKARPYNNRAFTYVQKAKLDAAISDYNQAIKLDPNLAQAYSSRGAAYSQKDNISTAISDYNQAIKLDPKYAQAYCNRGAAYAQQGYFDAAFSDYNQTIQLDPNYPEVYYNRGNAYYKKGDFDQAISDYSQAIKLDPNYVNLKAYSNRGAAYAKKGNFDAAIYDYNQAIKLDSNPAQPYNNRGFAYYQKGNLDAAISDYSQAIKREPNYLKAYSNRGAAYTQKAQFDAAISDYSQAIKLRPDYAESYNNRGFAYYQKGNLDAAISDYSQAIKLDPNYPEVYYNRGNAYYQKGYLDATISDYSQAIKLEPNHAELYYYRGFAYYKKGNLDAAISDYSQAVSFDPKYVNAYSNRAIAYFLKGEYDKSWNEVYKVETMGGEVEPKFLEDLKKASGKEK